LRRRVAANRCGSLPLVASNPFLGELKSHLSAQATKAVVRTVPSDYTNPHESELEQRLQR
jgi:protein required for attachment to host cells